MLKTLACVVCFSLIAGQAAAQQLSYTSFKISNKRNVVKISNAVGGFTEDEVRGFVATHCAGPVSALARDGKPRKRRGVELQKYQATCSGGINQSLLRGPTGSLAVQVEAVAGGKNMFEYTYGLNGNIVFDQVVR